MVSSFSPSIEGDPMKSFAVLVGAVAVAVFATAALTGNAGVNKTARDQAIPSLQKQVNELRSELICLESVTGNGLTSDAFWAASANGSPTPGSPVDDRGVCKQLGVTNLGTTPNGVGGLAPPFRQLIVRAFGGH
jgi:hypothetical protein